MRPRKPRKPDEDVQVNLKFGERLRRRVAAAAEANHVAFSREVELRLEASFTQSLADFIADFTRRARATIEAGARKEDIETTWSNLRALDATLAHTYTGVEKALAPYLPDPKVRELIRGAQQKQKEGGKS